jgi:hypothetical protein
LQITGRVQSGRIVQELAVDKNVKHLDYSYETVLRTNQSVDRIFKPTVAASNSPAGNTPGTPPVMLDAFMAFDRYASYLSLSDSVARRSTAVDEGEHDSPVLDMWELVPRHSRNPVNAWS